MLKPEDRRDGQEAQRDGSAELQNFQDIAAHLVPSPGDTPGLDGIDIYGGSLPLKGVIGGDHIIYMDFNRRYDLDARIRRAQAAGEAEAERHLADCKRKAGIAIADVAGHRITDGLLALMLHQSFLLGAMYELDGFGRITTRLFENLNNRFFRSSAVGRYLSLLYGEISDQGTFRFFSAGSPAPVVFSREYDQIVDIASESLFTFPPIGLIPSLKDIDRRTVSSPLPPKPGYQLNEISLMAHGDILLLFTDGLAEHSDGQEDYFPSHLEDRLREFKDQTASEIYEGILEDLVSFGSPADDVSCIVIKRL